ncbi:uncharacterized protein [Procambarus clarkii]|uniref:uncharacterized protein n=1 Tax=Procambarus clarkii TaxID=6728 RepID=UPI001E672C32|nr:uncharacterized protein LOC123771956 [Procambarus clarkii]
MGNAVQKIRARLVMERAHAHGIPAQAVFYPDRSRSPDGRKSSTGSSSEASWTSAQDDPLDAALESFDDLHDPDGALSDLLARTGEDDFMKAVLSFCSYMDGRMDTLDNSRIYDEFRSYTACGALKVSVA